MVIVIVFSSCGGRDIALWHTRLIPHALSTAGISALTVALMGGSRHTAIVTKWSGGLGPSEEKLLFCAESGEQYYPGPPALSHSARPARSSSMMRISAAGCIATVLISTAGKRRASRCSVTG
jgi:hypothetical protein